MGRQSLATRAARSASVSPAAMIANRKNALGLMNRKLMLKLQQIEKSSNDMREENLRFYHTLGTLVLEIRNNPEEYQGTDGTSALKLIEQALSTQARTLRKAALFAETYTEVSLARLIGLYNRDSNFQLHWGHVSYLLSVQDEEKRWKFAMDACSKMLSPPDLHKLIKKQLSRAGGHGRRHELPATPRAQVRQIQSVTDTWNSKYEQVWDGEETSAISNLLELPPDDVDDEILQNMIETEQGLRLTAENANRAADRFARIIERTRKVLEKKKAEEAAAVKNGKESRSIDLGESSSTKGRRRAVA